MKYLLRKYWYIPVLPLVAMVEFLFLFHAALERKQEAWNNPKYHRDPRAPKVCMCLWEQFAFRVPCEDIPPELLKE